MRAPSTWPYAHTAVRLYTGLRTAGIVLVNLVMRGLQSLERIELEAQAAGGPAPMMR